MSLVGTRPILPDELEQYELHHRARIAIKPGITGMWQVSGRSDITDFEEIVRLDTEYISQWNIGLDIKILFKTVLAVLKRDTKWNRSSASGSNASHCEGVGMLGDITAADEIYIVTGRTDMRKSIDGLCAIVEDQLHMYPRRSALYLFCEVFVLRL